MQLVIGICLAIAVIVIPLVILKKRTISDAVKENSRKSEEFEQVVIASGFKIDKRIEHPETSTLFFVDNSAKKWTAKTYQNSYKTYSYDDLLNYEVIENNESMATATLDAIIVGGVFQTDKNITSVCSMLQIRISVDDLQSPSLTIPIIVAPVQKNTQFYAKALNDTHEIASTLAYIMAHKTVTNTVSNLDT